MKEKKAGCPFPTLRGWAAAPVRGLCSEDALLPPAKCFLFISIMISLFFLLYSKDVRLLSAIIFVSSCDFCDTGHWQDNLILQRIMPSFYTKDQLYWILPWKWFPDLWQWREKSKGGTFWLCSGAFCSPLWHFWGLYIIACRACRLFPNNAFFQIICLFSCDLLCWHQVEPSDNMKIMIEYMDQVKGTFCAKKLNDSMTFAWMMPLLARVHWLRGTIWLRMWVNPGFAPYFPHHIHLPFV